jgi:aconitate hydratase
MPARVLLQDFTGRALRRRSRGHARRHRALGGDPQKVNPLQPVELVIDHSVQVDHFGSADALR